MFVSGTLWPLIWTYGFGYMAATITRSQTWYFFFHFGGHHKELVNRDGVITQTGSVARLHHAGTSEDTALVRHVLSTVPPACLDMHG
ncbi:hypothetical protein TNCV_138841 [Trichonephila clavipes]|nr:hypothetical protein TNCV_138841 [Trichonephila clavipes]